MLFWKIIPYSRPRLGFFFYSMNFPQNQPYFGKFVSENPVKFDFSRNLSEALSMWFLLFYSCKPQSWVRILTYIYQNWPICWLSLRHHFILTGLEKEPRGLGSKILASSYRWSNVFNLATESKAKQLILSTKSVKNKGKQSDVRSWYQYCFHLNILFLQFDILSTLNR